MKAGRPWSSARRTAERSGAAAPASSTRSRYTPAAPAAWSATSWARLAACRLPTTQSQARRGGAGEHREVRVRLRVGGHQPACRPAERVAHGLGAGAHGGQREAVNRPRAAIAQALRENDRHVRGGARIVAIPPDRGLMRGHAVDMENPVADHATLGGEGGADQGSVPVAGVQQRGELGRQRSPQGGVDLLE